MRTPFDIETDQLAQEVIELEKQDEVEKLQRCVHCHGKLIFTHHHHLSLFQIVEVSRCTACGTQPDPQKFTLH